MNYFTNCKTLEELKKEYRKLAFENHPDLGGSEEEMKKINAEYEKMLKNLSNKEFFESDYKEEHDWKNDKFADIIQKIITFPIRIEIIGSWIWCFDSFAYHEQLKELGFWFSNHKKAWVYSGTKKSKIRSKNTVEDLKSKWTWQEIKTVERKKLK